MIIFDKETKIFMLNTKNATYAMKINEENDFIHLHWGRKTECVCDLPTIEELQKITSLAKGEIGDEREYIDWGRNIRHSNFEPALKADFSDGTRDLFLKYKSHTIEKNEKYEILKVTLKDVNFDFEVKLIYKVIEELDIIERNSEITNTGNEDVFLDRAYSISVIFPVRDFYRLTTFTGMWAGEYQQKRINLDHTRVNLHSINGLSGPHYVPFVMLDNGCATENSGEVYFSSLFWSGNWQMTVEKDGYNRTLLTGGISDFDFRWYLKPNETFETPKAIIGIAKEGFGSVSRTMHKYERNYVMNPLDAKRDMPVLYNAYGTFASSINEEKIMSVIDTAASLGVELFLIDAGWNGVGDDKTFTYRENFGDWDVNKDRFPNGLKPISDKVHKCGMKFGIWLEPEAVHSNTTLYKEHPDWVHEFPGRDGKDEKRKYILNFAVDKATDYMTNKILNLIKEYNVDCFKMDCNMSILMAWKNAPKNREKEVWVRHVKNMYRMYKTIKEKYPDVMIENCAAGGFRADLGMLEFSGRMNRSDNQDPYDVLKLHEGFSTFILPKLAGGGCHISDFYTHFMNSRTSKMKFQAHVGMMGSLAIGKNLNEITEDEKKELKEYTNLYKEIRHIVNHGNLYRIESAFQKPYAVFEYVTEDKNEAVVFAFSSSLQFAKMPERIFLEGLDEDKMYDVEGYGIKSGKGLMNVGIQIFLRGDMDSKVIKIRAI
ncbi:MAG: hypothetical protein E7404_07475 [Ruminococcaceae bacterium]|nr:hypothetical protein [Oscillospiraceae bacterium]